MRGRSWVVAVSAVTALLAGACAPETATDGPPVADDPPVLGDLAAKPEVAPPDAVPGGLVVSDRVIGEGPEAVEGDTVQIHLVVVALSTGQEVDSTWELAAPRTVQLVQGGAVEGFLRGITGMRAGGRRELVIPPALAYGDAGAPPTVAPGETLVAVVDLLDIAAT